MLYHFSLSIIHLNCIQILLCDVAVSLVLFLICIYIYINFLCFACFVFIPSKF